jgi:hypothetical protein
MGFRSGCPTGSRSSRPSGVGALPYRQRTPLSDKSASTILALAANFFAFRYEEQPAMARLLKKPLVIGKLAGRRPRRVHLGPAAP